jgi:hypothetical protein
MPFPHDHDQTISRSSFREQLYPAIRGAARADREHAPDELLDDVIEWWLYDIMDGNELEKWGFWEELESWAAKDQRAKGARRFVEALVKVFVGQISEHRAVVAAMLAQFRKEPGQRYREVKGYFEFIQDCQHTIWANLPVICVVGGHASGDMFGIGASALLKGDMSVVVYRFDKADQDHSDGMLAFFSELLGADRVRLSEDAGQAFERGAFRNSVYELMRASNTFAWLAPYNMGTYFLMDQFQKTGSACTKPGEAREAIRRAFHVERLKNEVKVEEFLVRRVGALDGLCRRRVVVLWSRFTGKKGEYHPEHDTSFKGMAQMAWLATALGYFVVIAGDKPIVHGAVRDPLKRAQRYAALASSIERYYGECRCFNLTEFWTEADWKALSLGKRVAQYQIYELLHRTCDVRHLGMRSGNLEALALLGYFTSYMEEEQSYGGGRMVAWHGTEIGYERILLKEPPTRVGRYIHHDLKLKQGVSKASMPPYITARNRGFPGTASRSKLTREQQVKELEASQMKDLAHIPYAERRAVRMFEQAEALYELELQLEREGAKPPAVAAYESGFVDGDLREILKFLRADNPRLCSSSARPPLEPQSGADGKLSSDEYLMVKEIQKLL